MDDDAPGTGRARNSPSGSQSSFDPISDVLHRYASSHEPDQFRIRARLREGMRADGLASGSGGTRWAVWSKGSSARRSPVPFLVAAAVAVVALGIPLGTAFLTLEPETPAGPTPAAVAPTTSSSSPGVTPTRAPATKTKSTTTRTKGSAAHTPVTSVTHSAGPAKPPAWPSASGEQDVTATRTIEGTFDGRMIRYLGAGDLDGDPAKVDLPPMFELADGAVLKNVIIGDKPAEGIYCLGTCTLENVWWEDVGDDAATLKSTAADDVMTIDGGGARKASNSVFQQNGPGTVVIRDFQVEDFGKLYRSCGNCRDPGPRHVVIDGVHVTAPGLAIVGINTNYGDTASFSHVVIHADSGHGIAVCQWYEGVPSGKESRKLGEGPSSSCPYKRSDVTYTR
jgi:hypothetical protein